MTSRVGFQRDTQAENLSLEAGAVIRKNSQKVCLIGMAALGGLFQFLLASLCRPLSLRG